MSTGREPTEDGPTPNGASVVARSGEGQPREWLGVLS